MLKRPLTPESIELTADDVDSRIARGSNIKVTTPRCVFHFQQVPPNLKKLILITCQIFPQISRFKILKSTNAQMSNAVEPVHI